MVFFVAMGLSIIIPTIPIFARDFGATDLMIGALIAGFGVARVVFDLPVGLIAERFNHKKLLQIGLLIIVISSVGAAFATNYWLLLTARILEGIGSAFYMITSTTMLNSVVSPKNRGKALSYYTAALLLGPSVGPIIGGIVMTTYGARAPFLFYAGFVGIGMILAHLMLRDYSQKQIKEKRTLNFMGLLRDRSVILVSLATFALAFMWTGLELTVIPIFAYDNLLLNPTGLGMALSLAAGANFLTTLIAGYATDRLGRKIPIVIGLFAAASVALLVSLADSFGTFALFMFFYGAATGVWGQTAAWAADLAPENKMGTMMGINRTMGDIGFVIGPLLLGYLAGIGNTDFVGPAPFYVTSAIMALVGLLVIFARDPVRMKKHVQVRS